MAAKNAWPDSRQEESLNRPRLRDVIQNEIQLQNSKCQGHRIQEKSEEMFQREGIKRYNN